MSETPKAELPDAGILPILTGQKAIVTGGSSGIGRGIAVALAKAGADVLVNYHSGEEEAAEVAGEIKALGRDAFPHGCNVADEGQVRGMFDAAVSRFGRIDILVNNAGLQKDAPFDELTLDDWNLVIGVNLTGQFLCAREAVKQFKKQGVDKGVSAAAGKIVCVSSVHEIIPWAGHVNYAASKGGVMLMMKSVAQEVAPHHIRVNSVAPGAIRTPINRDAWETPEAYNKLLELIPYKRIGETDDVARAVVWLASDQADYVHGTTMVIDGGMCLYPGFIDNG